MLQTIVWHPKGLAFSTVNPDFNPRVGEHIVVKGSQLNSLVVTKVTHEWTKGPEGFTYKLRHIKCDWD